MRSRAPGPFGARTCRRQWSMAAPELFLIATPVLLIAVVVGVGRSSPAHSFFTSLLPGVELGWSSRGKYRDVGRD